MSTIISINEKLTVSFIYEKPESEIILSKLIGLNFKVSMQGLTSENKPDGYKLLDGVEEVLFFVECNGIQEAALLDHALDLINGNSIFR